MSETPQTDSATVIFPVNVPVTGEWVGSPFARRLERALAAATAEVTTLKTANNEFRDECNRLSGADNRSALEQVAGFRAEVEHWKQRSKDINEATASTVEGLRAQLATANERAEKADRLNADFYQNVVDALGENKKGGHIVVYCIRRVIEERNELRAQATSLASDLRATGAVEALAFYADKANYRTKSVGFAAQYDPVPEAALTDRGALASNAQSALVTLLAKLENKSP